MSLQRISTHILDTSRGKAAANVKVQLFYLNAQQEWEPQNVLTTDNDGRCQQLLSESETAAPNGIYKIVYDVAAYFKRLQVATFYPSIDIIVQCTENDDHYHVPLLLSPFGYTTYRGT